MISYDHKNQHVQSLFIRKFLRVSLSNLNHFFLYIWRYIFAIFGLKLTPMLAASDIAFAVGL